jgi:plastocyanin
MHAGGLIAVLLLAGCGGGSVTNSSSVSIAPATPSGDGQAGVIGTALPQPLRVVVTRDGAPAAGEVVVWRVNGQGGFVTPTQSTTGADGVASTTWTLGATPAEVNVTASAGSASGPSLLFGAIAAFGSTGPNASITLHEAGGSRFEPAYLVVPVGTTVTWVWFDGQHDLTPSGAPTFPGDPALHLPPRQYQFTFNTPGTYRFYCANHGTPTTGMRGAVVVQ